MALVPGQNFKSGIFLRGCSQITFGGFKQGRFGANYLGLTFTEQEKGMWNFLRISMENGSFCYHLFLLNFYYIRRFKTRVAIVDTKNFIGPVCTPWQGPSFFCLCWLRIWSLFIVAWRVVLKKPFLCCFHGFMAKPLGKHKNFFRYDVISRGIWHKLLTQLNERDGRTLDFTPQGDVLRSLGKWLSEPEEEHHVKL